ncbi:MAG TPA: carboxypeptidase regulatory-like domain-containing protein [Candidatus Dormibacteraeota bacterium]|nr:carboxypeptidase regulatory-like domain-containing protein [Candidatus Dormibacteraeota bacterium]
MGLRSLSCTFPDRKVNVHPRTSGGALLVLLALTLLILPSAWAAVTASISGTITDPSGAAVVGATVTATNVDTGVTTTQATNGQGFYSFQSLPLGRYTVDVQQTGFKSYRQTGLVLDVDAALTVDASLQVGQGSEKVEVTSEALHVETTSTQMGEVIEGSRMTSVPLSTRSYTDLLTLQPGVVAQQSQITGAFAGPYTSAGFALPQVSGGLNSGAYSVNGQREAANGFILNGISVQETGFSGAGAIPNLDSIAEFRILTNNFDAEYGNYSGGQINVITKSGTNGLHGNVFEFLRDTSLNAGNFFDRGHRGTYRQNQFGGTLGGPIKHDRIFFFADYQGSRATIGVTQQITNVPTDAFKGGDLSSVAASLAGHVVQGTDWAQQLTKQLSGQLGGNTVTVGEAYYVPGCTASGAGGTTKCVFPNLKLNPTSFSPIASNLLPYFLSPATPTDISNDTFTTSAGKTKLIDNKFSGRVDANTGWGMLSGYYYYDRFDRKDPYWASPQPLFPGFNVDGKGQTHNVNLGNTKTFGSASVNEFRVGFFRLDVTLNQPLGGTGKKLTDLGFASGANRGPGIAVLAPSVEGIPEIDFNNFTIGVPSRPNHLIENIYQVVDNYSKVIGTHTLKFGVQYHYNQLTENLVNVANGNFAFQGTETGSDFVDFLLGAPTIYTQGQSYPSYGRNFYLGFYGQDSWRVKSNLTFNYGLRYDVSAPWHEKYNEIQTLIAGEQSVVFPGAPTGWVFPGDPNVPSTLAPTRWNNIAPRLGLAYSFGAHEGKMGKILGKPGTTSIRVGYGMFYTAFEGATNFNEIGDAPFGNYTNQISSTFAAPFTTRATGASIPNLFPAPIPPKNFSAKNPANFPPYDTLANFLNAFGTIGSSPGFYYKNRLPYSENYELSIQRQFTGSDLLTVSYVGTQGHRLLSSLESNPGNPALCLQLQAQGCGPFGESNVYTRPDGTQVMGTRAPFGINFGSNHYFTTIGNSAYNSAQLNWRHTSGNLQLLVGYTFSKSIDSSSGYGEQVNPVNPRITRGLSAFDSTHNFVASYNYILPFDKLGGPKRLTSGWTISGITHLATGLPITLVENDDRSLLGTFSGGPIPLTVDTPNLVKPVKILDPRSCLPGTGTGTGNPCITGFYFDPTSFAQVDLGKQGTANRRFFHGPGLNQWDMAIKKDTRITERMNLELRMEFFNVFNHAQFLTPSGILNSSFGQVTAAQPGRIGQFGAKFNF